jgi:uncharacterized protein (TIGR03066 family)
MRTILGCALVLAMAVTAATAADDKIDAAKLVGKWEPKDAKKDTKLVLEFTKDGKLSVTTDVEGKEYKVAGTYALDGNKLAMSLKVGEMEVKETVTVLKLTDDEMVGEQKNGKKESFRRVKAK